MRWQAGYHLLRIHKENGRDLALRDEFGRKIRGEPPQAVDKSSPFRIKVSAAAQTILIPSAVAFCAPGVDVPSATVPLHPGRFAVEVSQVCSRRSLKSGGALPKRDSMVCAKSQG